jgi:hypothetical protein
MRSTVHNSCSITAFSAFHLIHIFSSSTFVLCRQEYSPSSSVFLRFLFLICYQTCPPFLLSSTTSWNCLFLFVLQVCFLQIVSWFYPLFRWPKSCGCFSTNFIKIFKQSISNLISFLFSPRYFSKFYIRCLD